MEVAAISLCLPVDGDLGVLGDPADPAPAPLITDTLGRCEDCGTEVWVGELQAQLPARQICVRCVLPYLDKAKRTSVLRIGDQGIPRRR